MPKNPINYDNTCFYKLVCNDVNIKECYVGHTTDFTRRRSRQRDSCSRATAKEHYALVFPFMRVHGDWDNWDMI